MGMDGRHVRHTSRWASPLRATARLLRATAVAAATCTVVAMATAVPASADPPPPPPALPPPPATTTGLSVDQAAAQAHASGSPVVATAATTGTDTVMANPDGTLVLQRTASPVRKRVGADWKPLDPSLVQNTDGSWSPAVGTEQLRLSGGGSMLAAMAGSGLSATVGAPMTLPTPVVSGATATYPDVLPGVDLQVTAASGGGFSDVFVVHDAAAAGNPDLATLTMPVQTDGVTLSTDTDGNIAGVDRIGRTVLSAPAPLMWDSTPPAGATVKTSDGTRLDAATRQPALSSDTGPGANAKTARVSTTVQSGHITLRPDKTLLTGKSTTYPVYIDPTFTWSSTGSKLNGWATITPDFASTNYWKTTPDPDGLMQVGNADSIKSHTLINFPIPTSTLAGATINTATMKLTEVWSWSCNPSPVNLYAPSTTLTSSNATWNNWSGISLGSVVDSQNVAHGYDPSCPALGVAFDVKSAVTADVSAHKNTQTFALTGGAESSDQSWKKFLQTSPTLQITYNHKPNKPTGLTTSPKTTCASITPTTVGDGAVTLYAPVSDPDGGVLGVSFSLTKNGSSTVLASSNPNQLTYHSGSTAAFTVPEPTLHDATGTGNIATFTWKVQATDFNQTSDWSSPCSFTFDTTRQSQPDVDPIPDDASTIGSGLTIPIRPPLDPNNLNPPKPSSYLYQLNGGPSASVQAESDGTAQISITPTRVTNTVTITSLSAGGNAGATAAVTFNSQPAATAVDGDLTGDNLADLATAGGSHALASGLWLANGNNAGGLSSLAAADIGSHGNGQFGTGPSTFDGAQILTGRFAGTGLQDVIAYYPTGPNAGEAVALRGNGDGSTIQAQLDFVHQDVTKDSFLDDGQGGLSPLQLANAGQQRPDPNNPDLLSAYPDLLGIVSDTNGTSYLDYYFSLQEFGQYGFATPLPGQATPTGGTDWNTWTITSGQTTGDNTLFLWQQSTGKLFAWDHLTYDEDNNTLSYTQYQLSTAWNPGQQLTLQSGDLNGDGTADLWAVGDNATATAWLVAGLDTGTGTGTIAAQASHTILTGNHAWLLNDSGDVNVSSISASDSVGTLAAAGPAHWNTGDLFDPDVALDGTASTLTTTGPAVNSTGDFTVSVWVKPDTNTGTVLSQDGTNTAAFRLYAEPSNSSWRFALSASNTAATGWTIAAAKAGTVKPGVWAQLTASYNHTTGVMDLHVNGADVATATHLTPWNATGAFRIGSYRSSSTAISGYLKGQIAEVQTYPNVVIYDSGNPAVWDFNTDQKPDLLADRPDGSLYLYRGNGAGGFKYSYGSQIGSGWDGLLFSPGDFDGDGFNDILRLRSDGTLTFYGGNGAGYWLNSHGIVIGTSWNIFNLVFSPGDFDGDGHPDVIARNSSSGTLNLYRGNGTGGWISSNGTQIGSGFGPDTAVFSPGDFDGDGHPDVIARNSSGQLLLYRGNGTGGWINATGTLIGSGFGNYNTILSTGDFNGDAHPDMLARSTDGNLWLFRGNGTGGWLSSSGTVIGTDWDVFATIF
jgi:hypothetical protein